MENDGKTRTITVACEVTYRITTCSKCGAEWMPAPLSGFESERAFVLWMNNREAYYSGNPPTGWFAVGNLKRSAIICDRCASLVMPPEAA